MSLQLILKSLEGLDEATQALYTKQDDGTFRLNVEGVEDVGGLKSALQKERDGRKDLEKKLKSFDGVDTDKYKELVKAAAEAREKDMLDKGQVDKLLEERTAAMRKELEGQVVTLTEQNGKLNGKLKSVLVDGAISEAAAKSKIRGEAVDTVKLLGREVFSLNDEGEVVPMKDGAVLLGKDGVKPLTTTEWVESLAATQPFLFAESVGGGGGGGGGGDLPAGEIAQGDIGENLEDVASGKVAVTQD